MKCYPTEGPACAAAGGQRRAFNPKTLRKYISPFIVAIADLESHVVSKVYFHSKHHSCTYFNILADSIYDNRYKQDRSNDCLLSVDGTDFLAPNYGKKWYSHKFKHSGLRYEVALSIKTGWICWISGAVEPWTVEES